MAKLIEVAISDAQGSPRIVIDAETIANVRSHPSIKDVTILTVNVTRFVEFRIAQEVAHTIVHTMDKRYYIHDFEDVAINQINEVLAGKDCTLPTYEYYLIDNSTLLKVATRRGGDPDVYIDVRNIAQLHDEPPVKCKFFGNMLYCTTIVVAAPRKHDSVCLTSYYLPLSLGAVVALVNKASSNA